MHTQNIGCVTVLQWPGYHDSVVTMTAVLCAPRTQIVWQCYSGQLTMFLWSQWGTLLLQLYQKHRMLCIRVTHWPYLCCHNEECCCCRYTRSVARCCVSEWPADHICVVTMKNVVVVAGILEVWQDAVCQNDPLTISVLSQWRLLLLLQVY